ncbi:MAG: hypothetical protein IJ218_01465 [Alphaproteobacteria bacterium]|nr:hypothetical protein [Alphaproteobacteria bacterium]
MKKTKKYGALGLLNRWIDLIPQIFIKWRLFVDYAAIFTFLSILLNRWTYACHDNLDGYWCYWYSGNVWASIGAAALFLIMAIYLLGAFCVDFYIDSSVAKFFKPANIVKVSVLRLKQVGAALFFWGTMFVPAALFAYILNKPANHDWHIEFMWFTLVFLCLLTVLLLMRCIGTLAHYFHTGNFAFAKIYQQTSGHAYAGIFGFLLTVMICSSLNLSVIRYFDKLMANYNYMFMAVLTDFADTLIKLFYFALILTISEAQYQLLAAQETDSADNAATSNNIQNPDSPIEITTNSVKSKKSAKKKKTQRKNKQKTDK